MALWGVLQQEYASKISSRLIAKGLYVDADNGPENLNKKIRNGEVAQYNFIFGMSFCPEPYGE